MKAITIYQTNDRKRHEYLNQAIDHCLEQAALSLTQLLKSVDCENARTVWP